MGVRRVRAQVSRVAPFAPYVSIADWVGKNLASVISYYPLNDATPAGTMNDAIGSLDGTYGSVVSTATIRGTTAADWTAITASGQVSSIPDNAAFDAMKGVFAVVEFSSLSSVNLLLQRRTPSDVTADRFQWFTNTSGNQLTLTDFGTFEVALATGLMGPPASYTLGVGYYAGTLTMYVNGAAVATNTSGNPFPVASGNRIDVGSGAIYFPNQELDGAMCELVFLSSAPASAFAELHRAWLEQAS